MSRPLVVAIDGPAGGGKSTVASRLAAALGWAHLDSGALFRAVAAIALDRGVDCCDGPALARLVATEAIEPDGRGGVRVGGRDPGRRGRDPDVAAVVARVARLPEVRRAVAARQRAFAKNAGRVVAEGRDMGTVVFPEAALKVFLDADPVERARRRWRQERPGDAPDPSALARVRAAIESRDRADRTRAVAPLVPAEGAWVLDTTRMALDEVVEAVLQRVRSAIPVRRPRDSEA